MTDHGPVALVYPYFRTAAPVQHLFQPLGIATLSAQLKALGIPVSQHDCTFRSFDAVVDQIVHEGPCLIGISVMATMSRRACELVRALRPRLSRTVFVAGGPLPTLYPGRFAQHFDVVFRGESDLFFARFCRDYRAASYSVEFLLNLDPAQYRGIFISGPSGPLQSDPVHHPASVIDSLPLPDRSEGEHEKYHAFWEEKDGSRPATVMLTRGCPYHCDFCSKPVFGDEFRKRTIAGVIEEIRETVRFGYNRLWIADDSFTLDRSYLHSFCETLLESGQGLTWSCLSRVDSLDESTTRLMRRAGCTKVYLGLESGSDETLRRMNKRASVQQGIEAVHHFNEAGIKVGGFFIVGYPGESIGDTEKTFMLALSLPLDEVSFNVPFPLPGSPLFDRVVGVDPESDWEAENETRLLFRSEFDEAWLRRRITETHAAFRQGRP